VVHFPAMATTREIRRKIGVRASPARVWKAITDPKELTKWFVRRAKVRPGLGGMMELYWGGARLPVGVVVWNEPKTLVLDWVDGTVVRFDLKKAGAETIVTLTHRGHRDDANGLDEWATAREGWALYLLNLKAYLERRADLRESRRSRTFADGWVNHWD